MATSDLPSNKLKLYLVKEKYPDFQSVLKNASDAELKSVVIDGIGVLYYKTSKTHTPSWVEDFFLNHPLINQEELSVSNTCVLLLVEVKYNRKNRIFAIPFGTGRYLMKDLAPENRFGLITTLNILKPDSIRSLGKTSMTSNPKMSVEQVSVAGTATEFQINVERDIIDSITGKSSHLDFGKMITGKDSLSVTTKVNINNLKPFLKQTLSIYEKKDYTKEFKWIDQIKEVKEESIVSGLDELLVTEINNGNSINAWLAVPEILNWEDFQGFKYSNRKSDDFHDELDMNHYITEKKGATIQLNDLEEDVISYWSETKDACSKYWSVYHCINAEVEYKKEKYLLDKSKWFRVEPSFIKQVEKEIKSIKSFPVKFDDYDHKTENAYNEHLASTLGYLCLDGKNHSYGGGSSKIEVCDLLTPKGEFIHVKKFGGSACLSHLFAQGYVSGDLFVTDEIFRKGVRKKLLKPPFESLFPDKRPIANKYSIVYVIITKSAKDLNVPFFSKVNLKNFKRVLEAYGYNIFITKVLNVAPVKKPIRKRKSKK